MATPSINLTGARPYNTLLLVVLALLSAGGAWFMRIYLIINDGPVDFVNVVASGTHLNGVPIKKHYTGIGPLDDGLAFLVAAFIPGAAGWNETFYWQQVHFLSQFATISAIQNVEACRQRNGGSWLKYTAVWAFVYQNIGGAVIIPIWMILLHRLSGRNAYFSSGRTVPPAYARTILPSTIILLLIPTLATYLPWNSIDMTQNLLAYFQFAPLLVNIPLWFASSSVSSTPASGKEKTADVPSLKILYNTLFVFSIVSHFFVIYKIAASENENVSYLSVFLPNPAKWLTSMDEGLLWIFQWDWIGCALVSMIVSTIAIYDCQRLLPDIDEDPLGDKLFKGVYMAVALTVLGGPAAALAGVWGWREDQLIVMEERAESQKESKNQ
ncbi:hypothetical protein GQ44DRAFT_772845 [Phaeosphaeriaceae sp. PMI808]|nr:hypothetical protein GQ44DRAFT_772845 [Phaeosphaeriaceae sp. PMI808]